MLNRKLSYSANHSWSWEKILISLSILFGCFAIVREAYRQMTQQCRNRLRRIIYLSGRREYDDESAQGLQNQLREFFIGQKWWFPFLLNFMRLRSDCYFCSTWSLCLYDIHVHGQCSGVANKSMKVMHNPISECQRFSQLNAASRTYSVLLVLAHVCDCFHELPLCFFKNAIVVSKTLDLSIFLLPDETIVRKSFTSVL